MTTRRLVAYAAGAVLGGAALAILEAELALRRAVRGR